MSIDWIRDGRAVVRFCMQLVWGKIIQNAWLQKTITDKRQKPAAPDRFQADEQEKVVTDVIMTT
jgi:hypothetical protein